MRIIVLLWSFCLEWLSLSSLPLKDELNNSNRGSKSSNPSRQGSVRKSGAPPSLQGGASQSDAPMSSQGDTLKSNTPTSTCSGNSKSSTALFPHHGASTSTSSVSSLGGGSASATPLSTAASDVSMKSADAPLQEQECSDGLNKNLDWNSGKPESNKNISAAQEGLQGQLQHIG